MKQIRIASVLVVAAYAFIFDSRLNAAAPATNAPPATNASPVKITNQWDASIAVGMTLTAGNSETVLSTLAFKAVRKWTNNEVLLGAAGAYGETTTEVTEANGRRRERTTKSTANASAYGQYNHLFTDHIYGGGRLDFVHDAIADLKYRTTVSPLAGYYFIKDANTKLAAEFGPSGVFERQGDEDNQYAGLRFGERFEHKFNPKSKVWQSFDYIPQVDRWGNYLLVNEIGAEAALSQQFSLRAVLQDTYDNEPAKGRKKNDIKLITSLVYKF